jgi:lysophospholipase L1-like esterase
MKRLSILGDSISTYLGVSDNKDINKTLVNNKSFYKEPFPLEKTYWSILLSELSFTLCVNNSYSGGNLSGECDETSGVSRARFLQRDSGECPDSVIIFMGVNDLGRNVSPKAYGRDYLCTLKIIKEAYPNASVCCVNIPDRDINYREGAILYNEMIKQASEEVGEGIFIADLFSSRLKDDFYYMNSLDGLHPDEDGMRIIAEIIKDAYINNGAV